ncbi:MAG: AEC family transporter [Paracoccus sp. (in: a-proteobacteria)]|nr:AEC family transporter [Paracoccus sp. (in: a-proteobacteria)]
MLAAAFAALAPVALLIALGYALRRGDVFAPEFWREAERLAYFILLPALFVHGLATADLGQMPLAAMGFALLAPIVLVALALVLLRPRIAVDGPGFTSVFQGAIRFNNYIGIMLALSLFGAQGTALAALANAVLVPSVNILSVLILGRYAGARPRARQLAAQIALNPLLLACVIGAVLQASGIGLPLGFEGAVRALGQAALPVGLICVGAALQLSQIRAQAAAFAIASAAKFIALPLLTLAAAWLIGLQGAPFATVVIFAALPTATSSYILSRQLGGDSTLMANIIAAQTVLSVLPITAALLIVLG